jgi:hypothetical protein
VTRRNIHLGDDMLTLRVTDAGRAGLTGTCKDWDGQTVHVGESGPTDRVKKAADWYMSNMYECMIETKVGH